MRRRLLVALAVMVLVGCGGTLTVQQVETPTPSVARVSPTSAPTPQTPTPTPAPTPAPTPTPEDELIAACRHGRPVPWAAPYAGEVHPLVVIEEWWGDSRYSDYPWDIDAVDSSYAINLKWRNGTWTSPIQLVLCAPDPEEASVEVGSCGRNWKRTDGVIGELLLYQYKSKIRVVVAKTGKTLQSETLYGSVPLCGGEGGYSLLDLDAKPPWRKYGFAVTAAQVDKYATTVSKQKVQ